MSPDAVGLTEDETARAVMLRLWSSSASPKRRVMVDRLCPMRPPLPRRANGVTENSASPTRRRLYAGAGSGWLEARAMLCRRVGDALFSVTPFV